MAPTNLFRLSLSVASFLVSGVHGFVPLPSTPSSARTNPQHLFDPAGVTDAVASATSNFWIATIDADIDSIPTNEFQSVFTGGIVVMFGGVLSALIVGFLLEKGDLYASVAAESYLQSAETEEFWRGLSEEEKKKTEEVLAKIKAQKEGGAPAALASTEIDETAATAAAAPSAPKAPPVAAKPTDMFSDYGD